jgi:hypothetical protein
MRKKYEIICSNTLVPLLYRQRRLRRGQGWSKLWRQPIRHENEPLIMPLLASPLDHHTAWWSKGEELVLLGPIWFGSGKAAL